MTTHQTTIYAIAITLKSFRCHILNAKCATLRAAPHFRDTLRGNRATLNCKAILSREASGVNRFLSLPENLNENHFQYQKSTPYHKSLNNANHSTPQSTSIYKVLCPEKSFTQQSTRGGQELYNTKLSAT